MRQRDGVISEAIYYDVVRTLSASTYKADAVIVGNSPTNLQKVQKGHHAAELISCSKFDPCSELMHTAN